MIIIIVSIIAFLMGRFITLMFNDIVTYEILLQCKANYKVNSGEWTSEERDLFWKKYYELKNMETD